MMESQSGWITSPHKRMAAAVLAMAVLVLIIYYPSIKVGFLGDDWWFLSKAASLKLPEYLAFYFDPRTQIFWYRPLYGIWLLGEYVLFGSIADGYHIGQISLHLVNAILLYLVIYRLSNRWRLAWLSAIVYAVSPVYSTAIFWVAVQDPLALFFSLGTILSWVSYLQSGNRFCYWTAFSLTILALLSKETSFFLPLILFLLDWWIVARTKDKSVLLRRYVVFAGVMLVYLFIEKLVQTNAYFPNRWGYGLGFHVIENSAHYLALLAFPLEVDPALSYAWLALVLVVLAAIFVKWRGKWLALLGVWVVLAISPALAFPTAFFSPRYLYSAALVPSILVAVLFEGAWSRFAARVAARTILASAMVLLVLFNCINTFAMAEDAVDYGRQSRSPLRDIYQQHPSYLPDTYLYFVEPPYPMILRNLAGMFSLRYGTNVSVWSNDAEWGGTDENRYARLREHKNSFLYYFDGAKRRHEVAVDLTAQTSTTPRLPASFSVPLRLEGYEITSTSLKRGDDLAILLYWKANDKVNRDYTVFVHLVNERGETILGDDSEPRGGRLPTSQWQPDHLVVDVHILNIPPDLAPGKYRLDLGLYYLPTMERLAIVDDGALSEGDKVVIEPFEVLE